MERVRTGIEGLARSAGEEVVGNLYPVSIDRAPAPEAGLA